MFTAGVHIYHAYHTTYHTVTTMSEDYHTALASISLPIVLALALLLWRNNNHGDNHGNNNKNAEKVNKIPGNPRGQYPIVGDTLRLLNPRTMASYQVSSRHHYGPIWRTSCLFQKCVFVSGAEHLQRLSDEEKLKKNTTACFPPHHKALFGQQSILVTSGTEHAKLRRLISPVLQPSMYREEIEMSVIAFVDGCKIKSKSGYFPLVPELKQFTLRVALRIVLGEHRWKEWMDSVNDTGKMRLISMLNDFSIWSKGILSPPTSFIPFTASYNAMKARSRIRSILLEVIEEERRALLLQDEMQKHIQKKRSFIQRLLCATIQNHDQDLLTSPAAVPVPESFLSEDAIVDNIFTLVFAGTDTTASILTSAFYELTKNEELLLRMQQCINKESTKDDDDSAEMEQTLHAFISEVQRCYPAAPFTMRNIADISNQGIGIDLGEGGYVPQGYNVTYAIAGTLLDDDNEYTNPNKFDMDRWIHKGNNNNSELHVPQNWAFGGGNRMCPGRFLSNAESIALLRMVLNKDHGFMWELKAQQNLEYEYTPGYFPKDGLMVKISQQC